MASKTAVKQIATNIGAPPVEQIPPNFSAPPNKITPAIRDVVGCPVGPLQTMPKDMTTAILKQIVDTTKKMFKYMFEVSKFAVQGIREHHVAWLKFVMTLLNYKVMSSDEHEARITMTNTTLIEGVLLADLEGFSTTTLDYPAVLVQNISKYNRMAFNSNVPRSKRNETLHLRKRIGIKADRGRGVVVREQRLTLSKTAQSPSPPSSKMINKLHALTTRVNVLKQHVDLSEKFIDTVLQKGGISPNSVTLLEGLRPMVPIEALKGSNSPIKMSELSRQMSQMSASSSSSSLSQPMAQPMTPPLAPPLATSSQSQVDLLGLESELLKLKQECLAKNVTIKTLEKELANVTSKADIAKKMHVGAFKKLRNQLGETQEKNKVMAAKLLKYKGMFVILCGTKHCQTI